MATTKLALLIAVASLPTFCDCWGQQGLQPSADAADNSPVPRSVKSGFRPAYTVTPVVQKIEARRGATIPYKFEIESLRENVVARVRPVALKQDLNGAILADLSTPPPNNLRISGATTLELRKGAPVVVEGDIQLPGNNSPFHTYGLLIRDEPKAAFDATIDNSNFGVNFVTQYILRCDVTVSNARHEAIRKLQIESAELTPHNGLPMAKVIVGNPNETSVMFEMDFRLTKLGATPSRHYTRLASPIRSTMEERVRHRTLILPHSRLEMNAPLERPVFAGNYSLESRVMLGRRVYLKSSLDITVNQDEFPAQEVFAVEAMPGLEIRPAQIALGVTKPLSRFAKLSLSNHTAGEVALQLAVVDRHGDAVAPEKSWVTVRPETLEMRPNSRRTVVLSLKKTPHDIGRHGFVTIAPTSSREEFPTTSIPIAFFGSGESNIKLHVGNAHIRTSTNLASHEPTMLVVPVINGANMPTPLRMTLKVRDVSNNLISIHAGFGKWLQPDMELDVQFDLKGHELPSPLAGVIDFHDAAGNVLFSKQVDVSTEAAQAPSE